MLIVAAVAVSLTGQFAEATHRHFARLRIAAGLPTVRLHDLRHTVVSLLTDLGVPPHIVQAIARHSDVKITLKIYGHTNLAEMRSALGKLDGRLS